jgi:hypothetical protein
MWIYFRILVFYKEHKYVSLYALWFCCTSICEKTTHVPLKLMIGHIIYYVSSLKNANTSNKSTACALYCTAIQGTTSPLRIESAWYVPSVGMIKSYTQVVICFGTHITLRLGFRIAPPPSQRVLNTEFSFKRFIKWMHHSKGPRQV